jgi:hypothetical protein
VNKIFAGLSSRFSARDRRTSGNEERFPGVRENFNATLDTQRLFPRYLQIVDGDNPCRLWDLYQMYLGLKVVSAPWGSLGLSDVGPSEARVAGIGGESTLPVVEHGGDHR